MEIKFKLENDYIELVKLLKVTSLCSTGGMAKIVVDEGYVTVDGETEFRKRRKIRKGQTVQFEDSVIIVE